MDLMDQAGKEAGAGGDAASQEQLIRTNNFREGGSPNLWEKANKRPVSEAFEDPEVVSSIERLKLNFNIDTDEQQWVETTLLAHQKQAENRVLGELKQLHQNFRITIKPAPLTQW